MGRRDPIERWSTLVPPGLEIVPLNDFKSHSRIYSTLDDNYIGAIIQAARHFCEQIQGRAYITQTRQLTLERFPWGVAPIALPGAPLQSVVSITYNTFVNGEQTLATSVYQIDLA